MITELQQASAASLARTYGFDGKFNIAPGFEFTVAQGEIIYEEKSGFKVQDGDDKGKDIMTLFLARKNASGKIEGLTLTSLTRTTMPANAMQKPGGPAPITGYDPAKDITIVDTRKDARSLVDGLAGKTLVLAAITNYSAVNSRTYQPYSGKCYHWQYK